MDLERMAVRLRPRNAFEALDLGVSLVRANLRAIYAAWLAAYLPAAAIVYLVFSGNPFWGWVVLWWLKPAFDRVILAVLAPALLGEPRPARAFFSAPSRAFLRTGLFPALTWRRLDLARSFHLPVHQLERLRGKPMRARLRILDRDSRGAAVWLTFLLANLEWIFVIAISLTLALLLPVQTPIDTILEAWGMGQLGRGEGGVLAGSIIGCIAVSVIEPFYVGCGFTLYLQRRTHLEGWDIELRFRQLAARLASAAGVLAFAFGLALALPIGDVQAETKERASREAIREVLADPAFGKQEPVRRLKYVGPTWKSDAKREGWDWSWLSGMGDWIAGAVRVLSWAAAIAAMAVALYFLARYVRLKGLAGARAERPDFLFGLDVRAGSLPDDVAAEAESLARRGASRAALSLLYRGSLVRFLDEGLEFLHGDTEGDCVRRVEGFASRARRLYFMKLVLAWQADAYAHRAADSESLVALAREWREHFERAPADPAAPRAQPA